MGKVLDLTPPMFEGDVQAFCRKTERYLQKLTERTDYELQKLKKQVRDHAAGGTSER